MTTPSPESGVVGCYRHPGREANIRCQRCSRPICPDCMRDASVGFQCPECVKEGAKTTRSGRAAYGGTRSANPATTSLVLIGINVAVWFTILGTGWKDSTMIVRLSQSTRGLCESIASPGGVYTGVNERVCSSFGDGRWVPGVADGAYWQLITSSFTHVEIWHIAANMLALYSIGPQIEAALGRTRFLALYFLSGLVGSTLVYWLSSENGYSLGASGAIYGLFGALAVIVHKIGGDLRSVAGLLLINLVITFAVPNISWQAHLGGFLGGVLVAGLIVYAPRGPRRATVQWLGMGGLLALIALAVILRSATLA